MQNLSLFGPRSHSLRAGSGSLICAFWVDDDISCDEVNVGCAMRTCIRKRGRATVLVLPGPNPVSLCGISALGFPAHTVNSSLWEYEISRVYIRAHAYPCRVDGLALLLVLRGLVQDTSRIRPTERYFPSGHFARSLRLGWRLAQPW